MAVRNHAAGPEIHPISESGIGPGSVDAERSAILQSLFHPCVVVAAAVPSISPGAVYPCEVALVATAVEARRAEFLTARVLARKALARLGVPPMPLVPNRDRSPRWPRGVVGAISHTAGLCAVAVASEPRIVSVGLDVEVATPLDIELHALVCTRDELALLQVVERPFAALAGKVIFCAKEAFYKSQYPLTRLVLDFHDVSVKINQTCDRFYIVSSRKEVRDILEKFRVEGRIEIRAGYIFAGVMLLSS